MVRDIASACRRHWPEIGLVAFVAACIVAMFVGSWGETVPFHFAWVSFGIVYGVRSWRLRPTLLALAVFCLAIGAALLQAIEDGGHHGPGLDEMAEVPLMAVMFLVMVWNVTARQRATEEVAEVAGVRQRLLEAQRAFMRNVSHGLRTPITVARGHAELIHESGDAVVRDDAEIVLDELDRMSRMAEQLLELAVSENPGYLHFDRVELADIVADVARRWTDLAGRRWGFHLIGDGPIFVDRERLEMALDALIDNAVRYSGAGDSIALEASLDGDDVTFSVSDSGPGIGPDDLDHVFGRFYRGAPADGAERVPGSGLGLSIVHAIAAAHRGSVEVSGGPGCTVTLRLPTRRSRPTPTSSPGPEGASGQIDARVSV